LKTEQVTIILLLREVNSISINVYIESINFPTENIVTDMSKSRRYRTVSRSYKGVMDIEYGANLNGNWITGHYRILDSETDIKNLTVNEIEKMIVTDLETDNSESETLSQWEIQRRGSLSD